MKQMHRASLMLVILMIILAIFTSCAKPFEKLTVVELLDLGDKYLLEMNYEQAIVYFDRVIEVEPKNVHAYLSSAEAYISLDRLEEAISILRQGFDITSDASIKTMLDELESTVAFASIPDPTPVLTPEPLPEPMLAPSETDPLAKQFYDLMAAGDNETAWGLFKSDEFQKAWRSLKNGESNYFGDLNKQGLREGMGVAYYWDYYVYYGSWSNGQRVGEAVCFAAYNDSFESISVWTGIWANDKPNGTQKIESNATVFHEGADHWIKTVMSGVCVDGLWNGVVDETTYRSTGSTDHYVYTVNQGSLVILEEKSSSDGSTYYIYAVCTDCNDYKSTNDLSKTHGIPGFADYY